MIFRITSVVLDIVTCLLVLVPLISGFRYGLKRRILSLITLMVSAFVAFVASAVFAAPIYNNYLSDKVRSVCVEQAEKFDPVKVASQKLSEYGADLSEEQIREKIANSGDAIESLKELAQQYGLSEEKIQEFTESIDKETLQQIPEVIKQADPEAFDKITDGEISSQQLFDTLQAAARSPEDAGAYAEEHFAAPLIISALRAILYGAVYTIMALIMKLMFKLFGFDIKSKAQDIGDRFAGMGIGLVSAAVNLLILCIVVSEIVKVSNGLIDVDALSSVVFLPMYRIMY